MDAVDLANCSVQELLQLQNCCHSLSQAISRRIAQMPGVTLPSPADAGSHGRPVLTRSSLEAHSDASSRFSGRRFSCSLPQHLEGDLGLWQAVQQPLFPKHVKTRGSMEATSRDDVQVPSSPGMLSVVTAPSDGGTTRGQRMCTRSSLRTQATHVDTTNHVSATPSSHPARCACCPRAEDKSEDFSTPVSSICGDGTADTALPTENGAIRHLRTAAAPGNGIPVYSPVAPIPECNSSLETAGSTGYNASTGTAQLAFGRVSGFPSSSETPVPLSVQVSAAEFAFASDSQPDMQPHTDGPSIQLSESCSSASPRSARRRPRKRDCATPPVQYGFSASPHHPCANESTESGLQSLQAIADGKEAGVIGSERSLLDKDDDVVRKPMPTVGPRPPTGLLSASLSQANSAGTSPHARGVSPVVKRSYGLPQSTSRQPGTCSAPTNSMHGSPVDVTVGRQASSVSTATGGSALHVSSPLPISAIPSVLMAEMACMGFHRPLRVGSNQDLNTVKAEQ